MQLQLVRDCVLNLVECCTGTKSTGTAVWLCSQVPALLYGCVRNTELNLADVRILPAEGFGHLLNLVGYTAIKDTGIFSVKTKVVPVFPVPVLNSPIF